MASLVAADVLVRQAGASGGAPLWAAAALSGGLPGQRAAEEDLRREGLDKGLLGRDAFVERVTGLEERGRTQLGALLARLCVGLDVDRAVAAGQLAGQAARTAFVRLFEAGLVVQAEQVVDVCPRCATTVPAAQAVTGEVAGEVLTLRVPLVDPAGAAGEILVRTLAPELLPGVVALAVPEGHPAAGGSASVPLAAGAVPVVTDDAARHPTLVVPAHDPAAHELSVREGLTARPVLDGEGTVRAPGPLAGLPRYAARSAARQLLEAEGAVVGVHHEADPASRCPACRTMLVPLLGRHWFLCMADLVTAAADEVREGRLVVSPPPAREELLVTAVDDREARWCLSQQLWVGEPVPVAWCQDCGQVDVSVAPVTSCRRCMGDLVPGTDVLDARFVAAVWPIVATGWPDRGRSPEEGDGGDALLVAPSDRLADVLAAAALGLRLVGEVPFDRVAVVSVSALMGEEGAAAVDLGPLVAQEGTPIVRVALLCGALDLQAARELVDVLEGGKVGPGDVEGAAEACGAALAAAAPGAALGALAGALARGVPPSEAARVRLLAAPFVGV